MCPKQHMRACQLRRRQLGLHWNMGDLTMADMACSYIPCTGQSFHNPAESLATTIFTSVLSSVPFRPTSAIQVYELHQVPQSPFDAPFTATHHVL